MTATSLFDWTIYRGMFDTERMAQIFGELGTAEAWIEVAEGGCAGAGDARHNSGRSRRGDRRPFVRRKT